MDTLIIEGVRPYDGRYELDLGGDFTTREWGWIKRLAGYHPLTVDEAYRNADPEFWTVVAVILLRRAGKIDTPQVPEVFERFADEKYDAVLRFEPDPDVPAEADEPDPTERSNGNTNFSGQSSRTSSENSDSPSSRTGTPASDTSGSDQPTLVS